MQQKGATGYMTWINKILKIITIAALSVFVGLPIVVYILLNLPAVQHYTTSKAEVELSRLLGVPVTIEGVNPALFNKLFVEGVTITDSVRNDTILSVDRIGAGIRIGKLISSGRIVFSFAEIIGPEIHLWRDSAEAELNIQPIIDRLSTGEKSTESSFDLAINNVVVRGGRFTYDVLSEPEMADNQIDFNHIHVSGVKADILVPQLSDKDISIQVKRLAVSEQSGIAVSNIETTIHVDDSSATVIPLIVTTKNSRLHIDRIEAHYRSLADFTRKPLRASYNMIVGNSRFTPSDIQALLPTEYPLDPQSPVQFSLKVKAADNKVDVTDLRLTDSNGSADISIPHIAVSNVTVKDSIAVEIPAMTIYADPKRLHFNNPKIETISTRLSPIELTGNVALNTTSNSQANLTATSTSGKLKLTATTSALNKPERLTFKASADVDNINLGEILNNEDLGTTDFKFTANGNLYN
ncbi:MAG: hypothetical protein K2M98_02600, partial [Muribaculum sp.]|nr:hypothetical protein [Muribaculum sp.]